MRKKSDRAFRATSREKVGKVPPPIGYWIWLE
jgi:hypothetical protein